MAGFVTSCHQAAMQPKPTNWPSFHSSESYPRTLKSPRRTNLLGELKWLSARFGPIPATSRPVSAVFSLAPKVGETINVLIEGGVRSFIVTGVSPAQSDWQQSIRLWVRDAAQP
jgi:hypothetical protein